MANKRLLKKEINYLASELFAECLYAKMYNKDVADDKAELLITEVLDMQEHFLSRVNHADGKADKKLTKKYFNALIKDLDDKMDKVISDLSSLTKE